MNDANFVIRPQIFAYELYSIAETDYAAADTDRSEMLASSTTPETSDDLERRRRRRFGQ